MFQNQYDIIVIGAGPAGLMAAIESYKVSKKILILEKMHTPALKLKISGKGRCNITNDADLKDFISHFGKNGRFLKFAFAEFFNTDLLKFFEKLGVQFKLERGGRYFPQNDKAMDIAKALLNKVRSLDILLSTNSEVIGIEKLPDKKFTITINIRKFADNKNSRCFKIDADKIVLASGGKSYPQTGSNGAGFELASRLGHIVTPLSPSLVPIETKGNTAKKLQGLSLKNVTVKVWCKNKKVDEQFGEMLFTDFGVSGPIILSLSKTIVKLINEKQNVLISIDLKPALDHKKVDGRILKEINEHSKQSFKNLLKKLLPRKLIPVFAEKLKISEEKQLNQINSEERKKLRMLLKEFQFEVTGYRSFDYAIVTAGGVCIKEINPQTMESKLVKGLYFAGEIIDINADTGGFNLQAAFSTGCIAGRAIKFST
ncbi:MAG: NAD(P)/FAD-dependent oxidoreductase [Deltaproteobacteria bacterium]|nr:NAD(P)/FAD-dependent oxidoreductase [Deltaproteobacteria bacterium]